MTALFIGILWVQNCETRGGREFSDTDWLLHIYHGTSKMRFQKLHEFSKFLILYSCHPRTHWWAFLIAPELMGHVAIPYKWKVFLFHRGCSFNCTSILQSGLVAGGRKKQRRKTGRSPHALSIHLGTIQMKNILPMTCRYREKYAITISGKLCKTAFIGPILARAQDKGLRFWQARSNA